MNNSNYVESSKFKELRSCRQQRYTEDNNAEYNRLAEINLHLSDFSMTLLKFKKKLKQPTSNLAQTYAL